MNTKITKEIIIPKDWIVSDLEKEVKVIVNAQVLIHDGKHTPIVNQITWNGYQMWTIPAIHFFDVVALIDKEIIDDYAIRKLATAENWDNGE